MIRLVLALALVLPATATILDSCWLHQLESVTVTAPAPRPGQTSTALGGSTLDHALEEAGIDLIRRGDLLSMDLGVEGLTRQDLEIRIDGERHPPACPNRMDNALTRFSGDEMESLDLHRSGQAASAGLGGLVQYHRRRPGRDMAAMAGLKTTILAGSAREVGAAVEGLGHRLSIRALESRAYKDDEGRVFVGLYPYVDLPDLRAREGHWTGALGRLEVGAFLQRSRDVPFPYLKMDERRTSHWGGYLAQGDRRVYFNRTDHLMDDGLRQPTAQSPLRPSMISDADITTLGCSTPRLDFWWMRWDLVNRIPAAGIRNHMIPDLRRFSGSWQQELALGRFGWLSGRMGLVLDQVGDIDRVDAQQGRLRVDPPHRRLFLPAALAWGAQHRTGGGWFAGALEAASAACWTATRPWAGRVCAPRCWAQS
ncbi:MAG: hypothetical protein Q8O14_07910 [bacterium]|nr:hypothetical protein [bacterium]